MDNAETHRMVRGGNRQLAFLIKKGPFGLGVVMHTTIPALRKWRQEDCGV
jgi:hypothetical protein